MDHRLHGPDRPDPLITVEPAPFAPGAAQDAGWARLGAADPQAIAPGGCPHRVRVRELKAPMQILFTVTALLVCGSALVALAGLLFTGVMVGIAIGDWHPVGYVLLPLLAGLFGQMLFGFIACVRVWRRLHRPGLLVCVLSTIAPPLVLAFVALIADSTTPWLMLAVVPPVAPMIVLWYCRSALYSARTCAGHPWLPPQIHAMRRA